MSSWMNTDIPRHIIAGILEAKDKGKTLRTAREKWLMTYNDTQVIIIAHFSSEVTKSRSPWDDLFEMRKEKKLSTKNLIVILDDTKEGNKWE